MTYQTEKQTLRRELIARRDALASRDTRTNAIVEQVLAHETFRRARAIHCYLAIGSEVETRPLIIAALHAGKAVAVPVVVPQGGLRHSWITGLDPADFQPGIFGTLEPRQICTAHPGDCDLLIIPMLGFDRSGYRLGYGKGYYDRILAKVPGVAFGVAFAVQELPLLPHEPHDIPLDMIATENELIAF